MPRKKITPVPEQESLPISDIGAAPELSADPEEQPLAPEESHALAPDDENVNSDGQQSLDVAAEDPAESSAPISEEGAHEPLPEAFEGGGEAWGAPAPEPEDDFTTDSLEAEKRLEKEIALLAQAAEAAQSDAAAEPEPLADNTPSGLPEPAARELATRPASALPTQRANRDSFFQIDFRKDRGLSQQEQQEWNDIYASFRSRSILTGTVMGVDENEIPLRDPQNGNIVPRIIRSLVIVAYRIKVLIPESEVFFKGEERGTFVMRGMMGAKVDYIITNVDKEGMCAIGSRAMAMTKRRRTFASGRRPPKAGDLVDCSVLTVGPARCLVTCGGYDISQGWGEMSYTPQLDMREQYRPGQVLKALVLSHTHGEALELSVKEAQPNPFIGADIRHPVGQRRQATITGKYAGGVFCSLDDGTVVMCLYSNYHQDSEFMLGDTAVVFIERYNYDRGHVYGRIVAKW